jgi:hypothetical protein
MARRTTGLRPGLIGLLLSALMLRLLIPAGFMLAVDAHGGPALVLCGGTQAAPAASIHKMHGARHQIPHDPAHGHEAPCPYAAMAAPVVPPLPPVLAPAPQTRPPVAQPALRSAWAPPPSASPPPPATGPPLLA